MNGLQPSDPTALARALAALTGQEEDAFDEAASALLQAARAGWCMVTWHVRDGQVEQVDIKNTIRIRRVKRGAVDTQPPMA